MVLLEAVIGVMPVGYASVLMHSKETNAVTVSKCFVPEYHKSILAS